jgi:hypothetical protein
MLLVSYGAALKFYVQCHTTDTSLFKYHESTAKTQTDFSVEKLQQFDVQDSPNMCNSSNVCHQM